MYHSKSKIIVREQHVLRYMNGSFDVIINNEQLQLVNVILTTCNKNRFTEFVVSFSAPALSSVLITPDFPLCEAM